ncbi:MAG: putative caspase-like protein [Paraglaciecola sp.]
MFVAFSSFGQSSEKISNSINLGPLLQKAYLAKTVEAKEAAPVIVEVPTENKVAEVVLSSDVDINIPDLGVKNTNAFAVVIGNAQYEGTSNVDYAVHDARAMKEYLIKTMGFLPENVFVVENATQRDFGMWFGNERSHKGRLFNLAYQNMESETDLFVYYAGHGAPDVNTSSGYFLPTDCDPQFIDVTGYSGELLFSNLAKIGAKSTTVVLDACFSGNGVITGLSAVAIKPKDFGEIPNGVILSSSSGTQPSAWYEDKNHGLFTYHFLKALQEQEKTDTNGDGSVTINEVYDYVANWVPRKARGLRNLDQNPTIRGEATDKLLFTLPVTTQEEE